MTSVATEELLGRSLFPRDGSAPAAYCVIAEADGTAVGFALYFFNYSTFLARPGLYLEDLFVRSEFRGRGFGKALLLHLAKLANARGCGRMEWTVLDWNQPAIDFYRNPLGAQRMKEWQICRLTGPRLATLCLRAFAIIYDLRCAICRKPQERRWILKQQRHSAVTA